MAHSSSPRSGFKATTSTCIIKQQSAPDTCCCSSQATSKPSSEFPQNLPSSFILFLLPLPLSTQYAPRSRAMTMLILFAPSTHRARTVRTALLRACNACIALQQGVSLCSSTYSQCLYCSSTGSPIVLLAVRRRLICFILQDVSIIRNIFFFVTANPKRCATSYLNKILQQYGTSVTLVRHKY